MKGGVRMSGVKRASCSATKSESRSPTFPLHGVWVRGLVFEYSAGIHKVFHLKVELKKDLEKKASHKLKLFSGPEVSKLCLDFG